MLRPSEGVSLMHTIPPGERVSSIGIYFTNALILSVGYPFSHVVKCWCGTIAARFSQVAQRHSHDLCRFSLFDVPSGGDDNCMLSVPSGMCDPPGDS